MTAYTMGFDIGTQSSKGILVDLNGNVVSTYSKKHDILVDKPGYQEESMDNWQAEFLEACKKFLKLVDRPEDIKTVGITGLIPGCCPVDRNGTALGNAILHTDVRAEKELLFLNSVLPSKISHGHMMPKILWIKKNHPEKYKKIWKFFVPHSYIVHFLTGNATIDYDSASMLGGIFDEEKLVWNRDMLNLLGVSEAVLPTLCPASSIAGAVSERASKICGLSTATKVIAGVGDTFASMLGGGAYAKGHLMIYLGTSATIIFAENSPENYTVIPHYGDGKAHFIGRILSFGESVSHIQNVLGYESLDTLNEGITKIEPGCEGVWYLPHYKLQTEKSFFGADAEFILGFRGKHTQFHIYKAMIEGIAYNAKYNILSNPELMKNISQINVFGGGANSKEICQTISDILGKNIYVNAKSSTALGIAFLAALCGGEISSYSVLTDVWMSGSAEIRPSEENAKIYNEKYAEYREIYEYIMKLDTR